MVKINCFYFNHCLIVFLKVNSNRPFFYFSETVLCFIVCFLPPSWGRGFNDILTSRCIYLMSSFYNPFWKTRKKVSSFSALL